MSAQEMQEGNWQGHIMPCMGAPACMLENQRLLKSQPRHPANAATGTLAE
jgi:hypothetical protein